MRAVRSMSKTRQNRVRINLQFSNKWRPSWKNRNQFLTKFAPLRNRDFQPFFYCVELVGTVVFALYLRRRYFDIICMYFEIVLP